VIEFKLPPHLMFDGVYDADFKPNLLALCIQPNEGIHLAFEAKEPETFTNTCPVSLDFDYRAAFDKHELPEAYRRLLMDALSGDASLFSRADEIEQAWRLIDPLVAQVEAPEFKGMETYPPGAWGPAAGDELLAKSGRVWRLCCASEAPD
jgi:glucose-6-phosphate 1-dehydrogenase